MLKQFKIAAYLVVMLIGPAALGIHSQTAAHEHRSKAYFDSLDNRIAYIQKQIPRLKQARDVSYYNQQRELDLTIFVKTYEEYLLEEDLETAKKLVETRLERAEFRRDQYSVSFYNKYKDKIYASIKQQRMHYQELFVKEKNFRREFEIYLEQKAPEPVAKARRMVNLALNYARENNLAETVAYLERYLAYTEALIFDNGSDYDLAELTGNTRDFENFFLPLVESDSLEHVKEAQVLVAHCANYSRLTGAHLDPEYFAMKNMAVTSAISDLLEKEGRERELARYTDQAVKARFDTLNPCGVFKWHDQIVVIDEFIPTSTMENVKKGEAIMHADKMLAAYLKKNKLCGSPAELKYGHTFIIPYKSNAKNTAFCFNRLTQKWQFIACYTLVVSTTYTLEVSKYMPPLMFTDELGVTGMR